MKPLIGITVDFAPEPENPRSGGKLSLNWNYAQVIADSGGVPVLIPPQADMAALADVLDGLLIPGGNDIPASYWGEENHPSVKPITPERIAAETQLYNAVSPEMPILGICYGCQFLNVIRGGSLIQHLPDVSETEHTDGQLQHYACEADSKLKRLFGDNAQGESWHHQAIKEPGAGLRVVATSEDGTIEAIEASDRPWLVGVQWHPERTFQDPSTRKLFASFIGAAAEYHLKKGQTVGTW